MSRGECARTARLAALMLTPMCRKQASAGSMSSALGLLLRVDKEAQAAKAESFDLSGAV